MKIQDKMTDFSKNACLALCYAYISWLKIHDGLPNDENLISGLTTAYFATNAMDENGFVNNPDRLLKYWTGRQGIVSKVSEKHEVQEALNSGDYVVAFWTIDDKNGHFVVMKNNAIVFNSLEKCNAVSLGHIGSLRTIKWTDK